MIAYILLVLIIVLLLYSVNRLKRKLDKVELGTKKILALFNNVEEPLEVTAEFDSEEAMHKAEELEKMYSEGLMNILTYGSSRRKKDE